MQVVTGPNAVDQRLPVAGVIGRRARRAVALAWGASSLDDVTEVANQHRCKVTLQLLRFFSGDVRQIVVADRGQVAAEPTVGLFRVGVDAMGNDLLAIAEELELLRVVAREIRGDLGERPVCAKRDGPLGRSANTYE